MSGCSYRPRPDNGSGDSPRPPFLTEFVNHIREFLFAHVIYHLIGGALGMRVHPHVERPFRLKAESARCLAELQGAYAQVRQQPVSTSCRDMLGDLGVRAVQQSDLRSVITSDPGQPLPRQFDRIGIFIEANQMTLWAEALCDFETVPAQTQGRVDIGAAAPDSQKIDRFF